MRSQIYRYSILLTVLVAGLLIDLYTKEWARESLRGRANIEIAAGLVELGYTENRGMVFGLLNNDEFTPLHPVLKHLTLIGTVFLLVYVIVIRKKPLRLLLPFYLVLAGAIGNALDKIRFGYVIDFIHLQIKGFIDWPFYFNMADAFLCIGIGWLFIELHFSGSHSNDQSETNDTEPQV